MKRKLFAAGLLVLALALLAVSGCDSISGPSVPRNTNSSQQTGIWVTGQGEVSVTPDMAVLSLGVEVQADTVAQAYNQAANAMDDIIRSLGDSGFAEEDIQTDYFRIDQETDYRSSGPDVIVGYTVTNIAEVKIRDTENVSSILDAAVTAGGDYIRIRSFGFTVDDPTIYYDEARKEAQTDAREKAEQIADNAGVKLGEATFIAESTGYSPYSINYGLDIPAVVITESPTFVSPGQAEVTIIIQVAYSIE
jgi:uncharacterized protein